MKKGSKIPVQDKQQKYFPTWANYRLNDELNELPRVTNRFLFVYKASVEFSEGKPK